MTDDRPEIAALNAALDTVYADPDPDDGRPWQERGARQYWVEFDATEGQKICADFVTFQGGSVVFQTKAGGMSRLVIAFPPSAKVTEVTETFFP